MSRSYVIGFLSFLLLFFDVLRFFWRSIRSLFVLCCLFLNCIFSFLFFFFFFFLDFFFLIVEHLLQCLFEEIIHFLQSMNSHIRILAGLINKLFEFNSDRIQYITNCRTG